MLLLYLLGQSIRITESPDYSAWRHSNNENRCTSALLDYVKNGLRVVAAFAREILYADYLPEQLKPLLARHSIEQTIIVQAAPTIDETKFL
jgi:uncharacterized NAD(P)/FAD-binding protein YdhS